MSCIVLPGQGVGDVVLVGGRLREAERPSRRGAPERDGPDGQGVQGVRGLAAKGVEEGCGHQRERLRRRVDVRDGEGIMPGPLPELAADQRDKALPVAGGFAADRLLQVDFTSVFGSRVDGNAFGRDGYVYLDGDFPYATSGFDRLFEGTVAVAVQGRAGADPGGDVPADDGPVADVAAEPDDFAVGRGEGETVAVAEADAGRKVFQFDPAAPSGGAGTSRGDRADAADRLPERRGGVHRGPAAAAFPVEKQPGVSAVEGFGQVRQETAGNVSESGAAIAVREAPDQFVKGL